MFVVSVKQIKHTQLHTLKGCSFIVFAWLNTGSRATVMEEIDFCVNECSGGSVRQTSSSHPETWKAGVQHDMTNDCYWCITSCDATVNISRTLLTL